jgi:putative DNA primase/helicase
MSHQANSWEDGEPIPDAPLPNGSNNEQLPEPQALPDKLPEVAPFRECMLPDALRGWVMDVAERQQSPPDFAAISILICLGSLLGRKVAIAPKSQDNWYEHPNLWGIAIGRPSSMKSPSLETAMLPLDALAAIANEKHREALKEHELRATAAKITRDAKKNKARKAAEKGQDFDVNALIEHDQSEPTLRRYKTNSFNFASLHRLLMENPNGLLVYQDEIAGIFAALENGEAGEELKAFLLTGWTGRQSFTADRILRGQNLHVPGVCLSLLGGTQPGKIARWVKYANSEGIKDDGFLQRFSFAVWPDQSGDWRNVDRWPDSASKSACQAVFDRFDTWGNPMLEWLDESNPDSPVLLRFNTEAAEIFLDWRTKLERQIREGGLSPALESHFTKYRKLVPALSLIFDLVEDCESNVVGVPSLNRALAWEAYLRTHAGRLYAAGSGTDYDLARRILSRVKSGHLPADKPFPARDVYRNGWSGLSDREDVERGLRVLADFHWLLVAKRLTNGATAHEYILNPKARD